MILILGGTKEGRLFAERLQKVNKPFIYSVTSSFAADLLNFDIPVQVNKLNYKELLNFAKQNNITKIIDLTHPYALKITQNADKVAKKLGCEYLRFERKPIEIIPLNKNLWFSTQKEAADYLKNQTGNILLTVGTNQLNDWKTINKNRLFIRLLPIPSLIEKCFNLGFKPSQLIAQQGPFSIQENLALINRYNIQCLVTKESGENSGFYEKIKAADISGIELVIIKRKFIKTSGKVFNSLNQLYEYLEN